MSKKFPPSWNEHRIQKVIKHYDSQSDEDALSEDEAADEHDGQTMMEVPSELVPKVRDLIVKNTISSS